LTKIDPSLAKAFQIPTYKISEKNNYCRHWAAVVPDEKAAAPPAKSTPSTSSWFFGSQQSSETNLKQDMYYAGEADGLWIYCYPNAGINCYDPAWYSMRVIPLDNHKTRLEYEIFAKKGLEESKIQEFIGFLKQVEKEVRSTSQAADWPPERSC
jgi:hypothetical protein